jgi:hypothetical protein
LPIDAAMLGVITTEAELDAVISRMAEQGLGGDTDVTELPREYPRPLLIRCAPHYACSDI